MTTMADRGPLVLGGAIAAFGRHRDGSHWRDRVRRVAGQALAQAGCHQLLINTAWLGQQIFDHFGASPTVAGQQLSIAYSHEGRDFGGALETAGGIARALPQLGPVFWVLAADVYTPGFVFSQAALDKFARSDKLAHLWLVPNPPHNLRGDFGLGPSGLALNRPQDAGQTLYTYSTIGLYRRALFEAPCCTIPPGNPLGAAAPLAPLLRSAMGNQQVSAELYLGPWTDVGTPARLAQLNQTPTENPS